MRWRRGVARPVDLVIERARVLDVRTGTVLDGIKDGVVAILRPVK